MSVLCWKCCNHQYVILDSFIWCLCLPIPLRKKTKKPNITNCEIMAKTLPVVHSKTHDFQHTGVYVQKPVL